MSGWTEEGLAHSWRALAWGESSAEWRFVHLTTVGSVSVEAGCHFPLAREALILSLPSTWSVDPSRLPEGKGFDVVAIHDSAIFGDRTVLAMVRRPEGSAEIFAVIVVDILRAVDAVALAGGLVEDVLLERIREWQSFMAKTHRPLSPDAQVGLLGELWLLRELINTKLGASAFDCWRGPLRAAQDFHVGSGAVEIKSTTRKGGFLARINSIEQLDSDKSPMFLCAVRFEENSDGQSLVDVVEELRKHFLASGVSRGFEALLMVMGYLDEHSGLYGRRLAQKDFRAFPVVDELPRLRRASLAPAVRSAAYVLDLDALGVPPIGIPEMISELRLE